MLSVENLTRVYDDKAVVDQVTFDVRPGRLTGFVGGNGAGKTTTMRMIVGVLAPTSGTVLWDGAAATAEQRRAFGYMPEERGLYPQMSLVDQLVFFACLHGFSKSDAVARSRDLLTHFGLDERRDDKLDQLSLGNQQRVQIAAALVHRPMALILDEPFSGLDPLAVDSMIDLLRIEVGEDVPVLFSSHQLELVERICDDLVILKEGRVAAQGSADELRARGPRSYRVLADASVPFDRIGGVVAQTPDGDGFVMLELDEHADPAAVLTELQAHGRVEEFSRHRQPLASIFREAVR